MNLQDETVAAELMDSSVPLLRQTDGPDGPDGSGGSSGPSGPIDIVFSFDTTGYMYGCIAELKKRIQEVINRLLTDIPGIMIALLAHGDYCDDYNYVSKWVDFTNDSDTLCRFVNEVYPTCGGDIPECYELVLHQVRTELSWRNSSQRSLVMIGDSHPHHKGEEQNYLHLDWLEECEHLRDIECHVYSVECDKSYYSFWKEMATITNGIYLELEQFSDIVDFMIAIVYREKGPKYLEEFEKEVRTRELNRTATGALSEELCNLFNSLRRDDSRQPIPGVSENSSEWTATKPMRVMSTAKRAATEHRARPSRKRITRQSIIEEGMVTKQLLSRKTPKMQIPTKQTHLKSLLKKTFAKKTSAKIIHSKKTPAKNIPTKKIHHKSDAVLEASVKKTSAKKKPAKKTPAKKTPAKNTPAKKTPAKKTPAKKTPAKKTPAKKTSAKKTPAKKTLAKKTLAKKTPAKQTPANKIPTKKTPAKKTPAKKTPTKKTPAKIKTPAKKTPAKKASAKVIHYKKTPAKP